VATRPIAEPTRLGMDELTGKCGCRQLIVSPGRYPGVAADPANRPPSMFISDPVM
jgi:hypothetical protein